MGIFDDRAGGELGFAIGVIEEERAVIFFEVEALGKVFFGDFVGELIAGPDLAVGVGVGAAHDFAFIFEDLDPGPLASEGGGFIGPAVDDPEDFGGGHLGEGEIVSWGETDHSGDSSDGLGEEEGIFGGGGVGFGEEGGEVVIESESGSVVGVALAVGAEVSCAEVASGIVWGSGSGREGFVATLPRAEGAVRGDEEPLAGEGIAPTVGRLSKVAHRQG